MLRAIVVVICGLALAGCQSSAWGPYISPRVTGRVLEAGAARPLAGVQVTRGKPWSPTSQPPKGAELMLRQPAVWTDAAGRFSLSSERVLTLYRFGGWNSVRLTFERAGYRRFQTNYSGAAMHVTNTTSGEPLVEAGDVLLRPTEKKSSEGSDHSIR